MLQLSCPTGTNDYHQGYLRSRYGAAAALGLRSAGGLPGPGPCRDVIEGLLSPLPPPLPLPGCPSAHGSTGATLWVGTGMFGY